MTAPLTAAELRAIEKRMMGVLDYGAQDGPYLRSDTNLLLYEDIPRLVATVKALRGILHRSYHCESADGGEDDAYAPWTWHEIDRALATSPEYAP